MLKNVISGGPIFIGIHFSKYLSKELNQVMVLGSLRTYFKSNLKGLNAQFKKEMLR